MTFLDDIAADQRALQRSEQLENQIKQAKIEWVGRIFSAGRQRIQKQKEEATEVAARKRAAEFRQAQASSRSRLFASASTSSTKPAITAEEEIFERDYQRQQRKELAEELYQAGEPICFIQSALEAQERQYREDRERRHMANQTMQQRAIQNEYGGSREDIMRIREAAERRQQQLATTQTEEEQDFSNPVNRQIEIKTLRQSQLRLEEQEEEQEQKRAASLKTSDKLLLPQEKE
jgi:hypothetical protein